MDDPAPLWVGTGWKMNKTIAEAEAWCAAVRAGLGDGAPGLRLFALPPFTALAACARALAGAPVTLGAQNIHWEDAGAWTGEISAPMARDAGARIAEIGHSERRRWFGETDGTVALKVAAARRAGLTPLVCVGESAGERDAGAADGTLARQVGAALAAAGDGPILLAYEPVWAIGAGAAAAAPDYVARRVAGLRRLTAAPVLYGGGVDARAAGPMLREGGVDGLFVGRAALDPAGFLAVAAAARAARGAP